MTDNWNFFCPNKEENEICFCDYSAPEQKVQMQEMEKLWNVQLYVG